MTMTSPEPDEPERPCFVPDEDDPHERELPMSPTLCWDDGDIRSALAAPAGADEDASLT